MRRKLFHERFFFFLIFRTILTNQAFDVCVALSFTAKIKSKSKLKRKERLGFGLVEFQLLGI